ncbi:MAG: DUF4417 domain-containing protein [Chloroflexota bacterium]|nr:DUF4417 domain-containing protein [Chloroflexota bacterium]
MNELRLEWIDPKTLTPNPANWRRHPQAQRDALEAVIADVGWAGALLYNEKTGNLIDGHLRQEIDHDGPVPVLVGSWTEDQERLILATLDPIAALAATDSSALDALLETVEAESEAVKALLEKLAEGEGLSLGGVAEPEAQVSREDVPDALWPSDNEWDIPLLDVNLQAQAVDLPVALWGALGRKKRMHGTWVFYCEDYRFEALWKDPSGIVNTQCVNVVEPNFTIGPQTPRAVALWQIYRKRWLARWWQSQGIKVFVDMNIDMSTFGSIGLLGVPSGWLAYATRGYNARIDYTILEYQAACVHAGTDAILFLLYGGGEACQELAQEQGWVWISEHMDKKQGGIVSNG